MPNETLFLNARVLTVDAANTRAEAVAVSAGRIRAVGSIAELRARAAAGAREIDLGGQSLIPGFVDAHSHLGMVGDLAIHLVDLNPPPTADVDTMERLVSKLQQRVEKTPDGEWVVGQGYDDTLIAEGRHPTRHDLDRASSRHPIVVRHISGHFLSANSIALDRAGITRESRAPTGGVIRLDRDGEPDGVFEESAMSLVQAALPPQSSDDRVRAIEFAARRYAELGITTAQHGFCNADELRDFDRAFQEERVPIRAVVWPGLHVMRQLDAGQIVVETGSDRLTVGAVKLFADGSIQGYTGHLCQPYHVPFRGDRAYRGYAAMPREKLTQRVCEIYASGRQVAVHVNGDAAIDDFLHAIEAANERHPRPDARPIAVHAQMTREDQLDTMQRLGVVPSFFSLHTYYWGDRHREIFIGPERADRISPMRSARDRDMRFTIHTDAPVVPMDPLLLLWSAIHRRTSSGRELGVEQSLGPLEALRATTIDAAWQLFQESERGSIEVGKLADFAVLDHDPYEAAEALREARITATYVSGEPV